MTNTDEARIQLTWVDGLAFDTGRPGGPPIRIDASGGTGPGPMDVLLCAMTACSATDVVEILAKGRTPVESLQVDVVGRRVSTNPRRLSAVELRYLVRGKTVERAAAHRAVQLALDKYCSVRHSLDPQISLTFTVVVNGDASPQV